MKSVEDRLRELPEDAALKRIEADDLLRRRILKAAAEKPQKRSFPMRWAAAAAALVLVLAGVFASVSLHGRKPMDPMLTSQSAGEAELGDNVRVTALLDVHKGTVSISASGAPDYRSVWARGSGANFPLVIVGGRCYRLLTAPGEIAQSLIGEALGTITEYTAEPALSGADAVSNVCPEGTTVYAVSGMKGAVAAAMVEGRMRAFQRVSFAGKALVGGESLADTLRADQISVMELSGVGTVAGADASALWSVLCSGAAYMNASCAETGQSLLITLTNGLTVQLSVNGETVSACGTWACPDFFEAFAGAQ